VKQGEFAVLGVPHYFPDNKHRQSLLRDDWPPSMEAQVARGIITDAPHVLDVVQLGAHMGAPADPMSSQCDHCCPYMPVDLQVAGYE